MNTENINPGHEQTITKPNYHTAELIIDGITDLVEDAYGIISLIISSADDDQKILSRKNFSFFNTKEGSFEFTNGNPDFISMNEFAEALALSLSPADDEESILALAIFDYSEGVFSEEELGDPEEVYQWILEDGSIFPDDYSNTTWGEILVQPGPEFIDGKFEFLPVDEEDFELPDTSIAAPFMTSLVQNASDGNHVVTVVLSDIVEDYNVSSFTFHKSGDIVSLDQTRGAMLVIDISSTLAAGEHAGVTLRSYLNRKEEDGFETSDSMDDIQEVRGWHLSPSGIHAFTEDECIEAYCIDSISGTTLDPEPNVKYCTAWS